MHLSPHEKTVFFPFTGMGGAVKGMEDAGWLVRYATAVEILKDRCQTLRANFPQLWVTQADIANCVLANYGPLCDLQRILVAFVTCPCKKYTYGADIHHTRTGDRLYLEALRDCVLLAPEVMVFENVEGILSPQFARLRESLRKLRGYYCTQFQVHGHHFSLMRKSRVFFLLHRQPFQFRDIREYASVRPLPRLRDYLDEQVDPFVASMRNYIQTRIDGGYKKPAYIFDPDLDEPLPFLYNYGNDRSNYLVKDSRVPGGLRPFSWTEFARLHTVDTDRFVISGSTTSKYHQIADCVMPAVAEAVGRALGDYFAAIPALYEPEEPLGYRDVVSFEVQPAPPEVLPPEPISASPVELWNALL